MWGKDTEVSVSETQQRNRVFQIEEFHQWNHDLDGIMVNWDMIEQVLENVFDNAFKYSYENTRISVAIRSSRTQRVYVSIKNRGIHVSKEDAKKATEREWRSPQVKLVAYEGSGIGLWIVDYAMREMGGEFQLSSTDKDGYTEASIYFGKAHQI